ncbi:protein-L-isoaspartate(D-aspartate) O-methyltransferase [Parafrankia irregularis]|uniref:Protein-L-isoaspartate O-methyltransferase n=1 Tax=Parafrankia irregularis TaxID=795642 RepID=A0A0S4QZ75_9ACTN|nr:MULTISPECIES: methyltransferase, FxLD system [Frankiaceae]MBE3204750.1 methyltransferase, FxLD system [Parafrankia sp. CH37]CUU60923.1 protein-L-isoaspartate(D-aspartate) O-methyltransferase [Parafrankia irregularis]
MTSIADVSVARLREAMVERILAAEPVSAPVEAAMRTVPRELFLPDLPPEAAYQDQAVVTKRDIYKNPVGSVSQPSVVAAMLEALRVEPGQRILELGSGGYEAALLARLTGRTGSVVSLDLEETVVRRTHECLGTAGYTGITALVSNGRFGFGLRAPYDRIVVTFDTPDVPQDWFDQLVEGGRIIIPLHLRGLTHTVAFAKVGGILTSDAIRPFAFGPMQGFGVPRRTTVTLAGGARLDVGPDQDVDVDALCAALAGPRHTVGTGVIVAPDDTLLLSSLDLWLATAQPTLGRLHTDTPTYQTGPVTETIPPGAPAIWTDATLAFLALGHTTGDGLEIGVIAYGPDRTRLADQLAHDVRVWNTEHRGELPTIHVYPRGVVEKSPPPGRRFDLPSAQVLISWG